MLINQKIQNYRNDDFFDINELKDTYSTLNVNKKKEEVGTFIQTIVKEVKNAPIKEQKKFIKILTKSYLLLLPFTIMKPVHAQSTITSTQKLKFPLIDQLYDINLIPNEIVTILIQLIYASGLVGIVLAILLLIFSGVRRSIGQTNESDAMNRNVIYGLSQILLAPILVLLLAAFTMLILGNVNGITIFSK